MIIDGHAHACGEYLTLQSIQNKLNRSNIDMVVLTPGELNSLTTYNLKDVAIKHPVKDAISKNNRMMRIFIPLTGVLKNIPNGNEYVYEMKRKMPDKIRQVYWVTKSNFQKVETDYQKMKFDGIKFHQCWEKFEINDNWFLQTVSWATNEKIPIFIHLYSHKDVAKLIEFIKKNSQATIIIAHLFGLELFLEEDIKYFDNIFFDLSNCFFVSEQRTMIGIKHFGSTKFIMGSDTPYGIKSLEKTIDQIHRLPISEYEKKNILGDNLRGILKF